MKNKPKRTRYSDSELAEFKELLEGKLSKSTREYESLLDQIRELGENADAEKADIFDNSVSLSEGEMLQRMAHRIKKHIQNLQNALHRIRNKTYGVCYKTGELIDKRRLMAVPTTTQSLEAKTAPPPKPEIKEKPATAKKGKKIIEKKIKPLAKKGKKKIKEKELDEVIEEELDLNLEEEENISKKKKKK